MQAAALLRQSALGRTSNAFLAVAHQSGRTRAFSATVPTIDVERVRRDTRGCVPDTVFLNAAGSSLPPAVVVDSQVEYLKQEEKFGGYRMAEHDRRTEIEVGFYDTVARFLNCKASEVAFAESATRAWTLLFHSIRFKPGDRIITSASDYGSNFVSYLQAQKKYGAIVDIIPDDEHGQIDLKLLEEALQKPRAKLVAINHIPTGGGLVQPAREVGLMAKAAGVPFLLDACQSIGQLNVDVREFPCDMLTATGRKYLRGPRGTGLMYVREGFLSELDPCVMDQEGSKLLSETEYRPRADARVFEQYEYNFAGKIGLTRAIEYAMECELRAIEARVKQLAARLREALQDIKGVQVTDVGKELCGIVTFHIQGMPASELGVQLRAQNMVVSVSATAGGGSTVWFNRRGLSAVVRASPHYYNTEEEVYRFAAAVGEIARSSQ